MIDGDGISNVGVEFISPFSTGGGERESHQTVGQQIDDLTAYINGSNPEPQRIINDFMEIVPDRGVNESELIGEDQDWKEIFSFRLFNPNGSVNVADISSTLRNIRSVTSNDYERIMVRDDRAKDNAFEYERLRVVYQKPTPERQAYNKKMGYS